VNDWISPPLYIATKVFIWNWTNAEDVGKPGYKPNLEEIGPYVFR